MYKSFTSKSSSFFAFLKSVSLWEEYTWKIFAEKALKKGEKQARIFNRREISLTYWYESESFVQEAMIASFCIHDVLMFFKSWSLIFHEVCVWQKSFVKKHPKFFSLKIYSILNKASRRLGLFSLIKRIVCLLRIRSNHLSLRVVEQMNLKFKSRGAPKHPSRRFYAMRRLRRKKIS